MKAFILLLIFYIAVAAKEYVVIGSASMPKLTETQVRSIFLKKLTVLDDVRLVPLNLPAKSEIRRSFENKILRMTRSRLKAYWTREHYLGHRAPKNQNSQEGVMRFVQKVHGAIGYIEADKIDRNVKVLFRWSE